MSSTMAHHRTGTSPTIVCHQPLYVTNPGTSSTMACDEPGTSSTMVCHQPWHSMDQAQNQPDMSSLITHVINHVINHCIDRARHHPWHFIIHCTSPTMAHHQPWYVINRGTPWTTPRHQPLHRPGTSQPIGVPTEAVLRKMVSFENPGKMK